MSARRLHGDLKDGRDAVAVVRRDVSIAPPLATAHPTWLRVARIVVLAVSDLVTLIAAALVAYVMWASPVLEQRLSLYLNVAPLVTLFIIGFALAGLYPGFGLGPVETLRRQSYVTAFGFLILAAFSFAFKVPPLYSRVTFTLAFAVSLLLVPILHAAVVHAASTWSWWSEPVVVIGTGERAGAAIRSIQRAAHLGYRPIAVLSANRQPSPSQVEGIPVVGGLDRAPELARDGVRIVLLEIDDVTGTPLLDQLQQYFRHVVLLRQYDELAVEGLQVRNFGTLVGIEYTNNLLVKGNQIIKGILDVVIGLTLLVLASPIILLSALAVKMVDGGPVLFYQDRAGRKGRRIAVPKIRTMRLDAEKTLEAHLTANPDLRAEWEARYKLHNDPRLLPVIGSLFRRYSIDELPQLWTVLMGDMSLVGPRPFPDYHIRKFSPEFQKLRARVRPGISGLWQITVRSDGDVQQQEAYDSYYIRNWSVWLDLYILARTLGAIASGRGAY